MVNLHIIGAQKCGTTALAHFLHQHDDIYVLDGKEAHVFDNPQFLRSTSKMAYAKTAFDKRLKQYNDERYICDATPITCYHPRFLKHCYNYCPSAKFIFILRCPVERAISHYRMSTRNGSESRSMLKAFAGEAKTLQQHENQWALNSPLRTQSYLSRGRYTQQLTNVFGIIPSEQVLVLHQRDLMTKHQETLNTIFSFLGVSIKSIPAEQIFVGATTKSPAISEASGDNADMNNDGSSRTLGNKLDEALAKLYAKLYFWRHTENAKAWQKIIHQANNKRHNT